MRASGSASEVARGAKSRRLSTSPDSFRGRLSVTGGMRLRDTVSLQDVFADWLTSEAG